MQIRRTKIVATLGPATDDLNVLEATLSKGVDLVRLNFSHGTSQEHQQRIENVRNVSKKIGKEIGILADLQGPKIRIARFLEGSIELKKNDKFILNADLNANQGTQDEVGIDYKELPQDVKIGDTLLLDDGRIVFEVEKVCGNQVHCIVKVGGLLSNNKGINRLGGGLSAEALTTKDKEDLIIAVGLDVDYIAISFPRSAADVEEAKQLIANAGGSQGVIAKIERAEAVAALDEIIAAASGAMVARGDLGVEIGDAELPRVQKEIIQNCRSLDKVVITATQMMESMVENAIPTRAEVFDVANAVLDGTDAVMLSAESATGKHPDLVVEAMARICLGAEKQKSTQISGHRVECRFKRADEAIAMATMYTANHLDITCILALTESGSTPLWMSRIRSGIPIFALCPNHKVRRKMKLFRGVYPIEFNISEFNRDTVNQAAVAKIETLGLIKKGDLVILTKGDILGVGGGANAMKILQVGNIV